MISRVFVEKREGFRTEAEALCRELRDFLKIEALERVRIVNRYDIEGLCETLDEIIPLVLAEPQSDKAFFTLEADTPHSFIIEYLPGQFDARAQSAAECIGLITLKEAPRVRSGKVVLLYGELDASAVEAIKRHLINPVEAREASAEMPKTLLLGTQTPLVPPVIEGFCKLDTLSLDELRAKYSLAMDVDDLVLMQGYFKGEKRDPTETELKVVDTYWSDHCRHTTFNTELCDIEILDQRVRDAYEDYLLMREATLDKKPVTLMDIGTMGARYNKKRGKLERLDVSDEINACTVNTDIIVDGEKQAYKVLFKNETHNHPTEIEPFGGAATCIGGCIRDPLSGRAEVYQAMRISGAGDPTRPNGDVLEGKLHQKTIVTKAAEGYSSYGNQIGLATGLVHEIYHEGYVAKHLELGAVIGACPSENVVRLTPEPGDVILLAGGRTGRDGCGGATGSSRKHDESSLTACGAQVQKGNAPEERKLQRLFMNKSASRLIKRCNDFGAGGVSVAIGELAGGVLVDLDSVKRKYDGLTPTELAISESQERMAVVVAPEDEQEFMRLAREENIECSRVAVVTEEKRLKLTRAGVPVCDLSRAFLDTNGAKKRADVLVKNYLGVSRCEKTPASLAAALEAAAKNRSGKTCRGLIELFDQTIGARTLLLPLGGKRFATQTQVMAALIPVDGGTDACSVMSYGFDPDLMADPFGGAFASVVMSVAKLAASGAPLDECYLSFQEYFESMHSERERFGKPFSALLGALKAQKELGLSAIGGKDSMSGTYLDLSVPPTLVSFAVAITNAKMLISPEFKAAGHDIALFTPPDTDLRRYLDNIASLAGERTLLSAYAVERGGALAAIFEMSRGNGVGAELTGGLDRLSRFIPGAVVAELCAGAAAPENSIIIGKTSENFIIALDSEAVNVLALERLADAALEKVYPARYQQPLAGDAVKLCHAVPRVKKSGQNLAAPRVIIPVFAGTNCEEDARRAFISAGARSELFVVNTLSPLAASESAKALAKKIGQSQIVFLPGGFSYADEPDGSGKSIAAFFRNPYIMESVSELIKMRDGLMGGVCNGFQALIKLGLVPFGEIRPIDDGCPTLFKNAIGRHVARMTYTRVASNASPWLMRYDVGDVELIPISHGEGRFVCNEELFNKLAATGQIATQYCDELGRVGMEIDKNPNGSFMAVEGLLSQDGRVFGRMAHAERMDKKLYINASQSGESRMFAGAVDYYRR